MSQENETDDQMRSISYDELPPNVRSELDQLEEELIEGMNKQV